MDDQLDQIEKKLIAPSPTHLTIISGLAGSGKTTFTRSVEQAYSMAVYHDYWVEQQYQVDSVQWAMCALFPKALRNSNITKANILEWITEEPARNTILANFFKARFVLHLSALLQDNLGNVVVECPFLDSNLSALKHIYNGRVKILWMMTPDCIEERLIARGWSDGRIARTMRMQNQMYRRYEGEIDEHLQNAF